MVHLASLASSLYRLRCEGPTFDDDQVFDEEEDAYRKLVADGKLLHKI